MVYLEAGKPVKKRVVLVGGVEIVEKRLWIARILLLVNTCERMGAVEEFVFISKWSAQD